MSNKKKHEFCRWCKNFYTEKIEIDEEDCREINYCKLDNIEIRNSYDCCEKYQFDKVKFKEDRFGRFTVSIQDSIEKILEKEK